MKNWTWVTFRGKVVTADTIDHQHVSNILWYLKIVMEDHDPNSKEIRDLKEILNDRFNGQILPYRPHTKFTAEKDFLKEKGMLQNPSMFGVDIIYKGRKIGEYSYHVEVEL